MTTTLIMSITVITMIISLAWLATMLYQHYIVWMPKYRAQMKSLQLQRAYLDSFTPEKIASMSDEEKEQAVYRLLAMRIERKENT